MPLGDNTFSHSLLFEIMEIETGAIKYINIIFIIFYIILEKFVTLLIKTIFLLTEILGFFIPKKIDVQNALATVTWWTKDLLAAKAK